MGGMGFGKRAYGFDYGKAHRWIGMGVTNIFAQKIAHKMCMYCNSHQNSNSELNQVAQFYLHSKNPINTFFHQFIIRLLFGFVKPDQNINKYWDGNADYTGEPIEFYDDMDENGEDISDLFEEQVYHILHNSELSFLSCSLSKVLDVWNPPLSSNSKVMLMKTVYVWHWPPSLFGVLTSQLNLLVHGSTFA